jgi:DNA-binding MarR family transcriptional regulator
MDDEGILELFYKAHRKLGELESTPRDYGTGEPLFSSDIHTVVAVAGQPGCNLTQLASALGVSKPAAYKFARKLLRMGYLSKEMRADSAKAVAFTLSPKGEKAVQAHQRFTRKVFGPLQAVESRLSGPERRVIHGFLEAILQASSWLRRGRGDTAGNA